MFKVHHGSLGGRAGARLAALMLLAASAAVSGGAAHAQSAAAATPPAQADAKSSANPGSVKEHLKQLGEEVSDPGTLQRIKAHEQEAEKRVDRVRERQRKDHGQARPGDAVDLAKNVDKADGAVPGKPAGTAATHKKVVESAPPPPPAPASATKPTLAR